MRGGRYGVRADQLAGNPSDGKIKPTGGGEILEKKTHNINITTTGDYPYLIKFIVKSEIETAFTFNTLLENMKPETVFLNVMSGTEGSIKEGFIGFGDSSIRLFYYDQTDNNFHITDFSSLDIDTFTDTII